MNNSTTYQYEQRIKYLESRILELENELHMSKCTGHRQIRKESNKKEELVLALKELNSKTKKTQSLRMNQLESLTALIPCPLLSL